VGWNLSVLISSISNKLQLGIDLEHEGENECTTSYCYTKQRAHLDLEHLQ
jgi:hypothetical protein